MMYVFAVVGIILIVVLVRQFGKPELKHIGTMEEAQKRLAQEYIDFALTDWLVADNGKLALGWDAKQKQLLVSFVHGLFVLDRLLTSDMVVSSKIEQLSDKVSFHFVSRHFDRSDFRLEISLDKKEQMEEWKNRVKGILLTPREN